MAEAARAPLVKVRLRRPRFSAIPIERVEQKC